AAVRHLASLGRRRIAHISGPLDQTSAVDRLDGWRDITEAAGSGLEAGPGLLAYGDFTPEGGARAMSALLERRPDLDGVFAASDLTASGALWALRDAGLRVPEDVAVVGFDDLRTVAQHTEPPLTTVRQDIEEMGRLMARSLLDAGDRAGSPESAKRDGVILPTTLVRRASA
ncbi:substrate-binding domain-containing protein, partial [Streptomyces diastaticus]